VRDYLEILDRRDLLEQKERKVLQGSMAVLERRVTG
jgi:hypothetical protein